VRARGGAAERDAGAGGRVQQVRALWIGHISDDNISDDDISDDCASDDSISDDSISDDCISDDCISDDCISDDCISDDWMTLRGGLRQVCTPNRR
jgi:hypothetical protein